MPRRGQLRGTKHPSIRLEGRPHLASRAHRSGSVPVDTERLHRQVQTRPVHGVHAAVRQPQRLGNHRGDLDMHRSGAVATDQRPAGVIRPVDEPLVEHAEPRRAPTAGQRTRRLGQHREVVAALPGRLLDRLDQQVGRPLVAHRVVVEGAVRLDVGERHAPPLRLCADEQHLRGQVGDESPHAGRLGSERGQHRATPEAGPVPIGRVGADADAGGHGRRYRLTQQLPAPGVRTGGHVRRGHDRQQRPIVPHPLAQVRVEVDPHMCRIGTKRAMGVGLPRAIPLAGRSVSLAIVTRPLQLAA